MHFKYKGLYSSLIMFIYSPFLGSCMLTSIPSHLSFITYLFFHLRYGCSWRFTFIEAVSYHANLYHSLSISFIHMTPAHCTGVLSHAPPGFSSHPLSFEKKNLALKGWHLEWVWTDEETPFQCLFSGV